MSHLVSKHLLNDRAIVFSEAMVGVLSGQDRRMRVGDVMASTTDLFQNGKTLDGAEPAGYEIGQWKGRCICEDGPVAPVDGETYFAWVSTNYWDYDLNLVFFTKAEFMTLFEDCCRNFVAAFPERKLEFEQALAANGMHL